MSGRWKDGCGTASSHVASLVTLSEHYERVGRWRRRSVPEGTRDESLRHNILLWHAQGHGDHWQRNAELNERGNKKRTR
jgi:hypothetical protein